MNLEQDDRLGLGGTLTIFRRALRYVGPFRGRFAIKILLTILALLPGALLAVPAKILVDHVVLGVPVAELFDSSFADAVLAPLAWLTQAQCLSLMIGLQLLLVLLIGAFGTGSSQRAATQGSLFAGQDEASSSEEGSSYAESYSGGLFGLLDYRFMLRLTQDLNQHYRSVLFRRLQQLPMSVLDDERIGDAVYRVLYDTPAITGLAYRVTLTPIVTCAEMAFRAGLLVALYPQHGELAVVGLLLCPLVVLATLPFGGWIRRRGMRSRGAGARTTSTIEEGMANVVAVQGLGGSARERERFDRDSGSSFAAFRSLVLAVIFAYSAGTVAFLVLAGWIFVYITDLGIRGQIQPGDYLVLINSFAGIALFAASLGRLWVDLQLSAPGLSRVFFLMDLPSEEDRPGTGRLGDVRSGVELLDVDFDYAEGTPALRGVSLKIPVGQVTALCGPAGAGKTTLAYMIPHFLAPTRGSVRIDGVPVERFSRDSLRAQIAFVFQETVLFDATVRENLLLANPRASDADLVRAARSAGAHDFIMALPQGYDTRLGRMGGKLSVGQKQRLAIARALVRDARILIFDEPTSALDPQTERDLVQSLREASADRAVVVIAHRLSTIRTADQIAFLRGGRIVECGSHAVLMARPDGAYRRFVELQMRGAA